MDVGLIEATPDPFTRDAVYALWKAARDVARDLDPRLDAAEAAIHELRPTVAHLQQQLTQR
jgi:hypothetical protein